MTFSARFAAMTALWFAIDIIAVSAFAVSGRSTRGVGLDGFLAEAAPFYAGVVVGWLVMRAWRRPIAIMWTGVGLWVSTFVVGVSLRSLTGGSVDSAFVVVTFIALIAFLVGWRGIAWILDALFGKVPDDRPEPPANTSREETPVRRPR